MHTASDAQPLKILHVASHNEIRAGGSVQMLRLALGQKELGHEVWAAFNIRRGDDPPGLGTFGPLRDAGIPIVSFPMQKLWKYGGMLRFRRFLSGQGFDVVHAHRFRALNFVHTATLGMGLRAALLGDKKNGTAISPAWARVYGSSRVDCIVVNAGMIQKLLTDTGRVSPDKIEIIYNGVDLEHFHPGVDGSGLRQSLAIAEDAPLFGMIANFLSVKAHDVFFDAAQRVLKEIPQAKFLCAGSGDSRRHQDALREKGVAASFIFTGFRTDIPAIIAALDASVISSKSEGLNGSIVEAMAMGKPVISTAVGGNPEFVKNMETGLLVPPGDAEALARAMLYIINNKNQARQLGTNAYAFVKDKVDNRQRSQRFAELYRDLLRRKKAG